MTTEQPSTITRVPDAELGVDDHRKPPTGTLLGFLKTLRSLQTLSGVVAIFMIPVLWAAWSQTVLLTILGVISGSVIFFTVLSHVLYGYYRRGDL